MGAYDELIARLPEEDRDNVRELAENVLFMRRKLAETRKGISKQQVVIPYDNGGGQTGIRENPAYVGYHKLLKSYMSALDELRSLLGTDAPEPEAAKPESTLAAARRGAKFSKFHVA